MKQHIWDQFTELTDEELEILRGRSVEKYKYTDNERFIVSSAKLLEGAKLDLRPHTRFIDFPEHGHDYTEFMYVYSGRITHIIGKEKITLEEGDLIFLNRHIRHSVCRAEREDIGINFILSNEFLRTVYPNVRNNAVMCDFLTNNIDDAGEPEYLLFRTKDNIPIRNVTDNLIYAIAGHTENLYAELVSLLFSYLAHYADTLANALRVSSNEAKFKRAVLDYLDRRYTNASLSELSTLMGYSLSYLSRHIRTVFKRTFQSLLQEKRLLEAEKLLRNTNLNIEEIIYLVGYENQAHFYRIFAKAHYATPRKFRASDS